MTYQSHQSEDLTLKTAGSLDLNSLNEYGVPLHACNGYRCDEHYWAWLRAKRLGLIEPNYQRKECPTKNLHLSLSRQVSDSRVG